MTGALATRRGRVAACRMATADVCGKRDLPVMARVAAHERARRCVRNRIAPSHLVAEPSQNHGGSKAAKGPSRRRIELSCLKGMSMTAADAITWGRSLAKNRNPVLVMAKDFNAPE